MNATPLAVPLGDRDAQRVRNGLSLQASRRRIEKGVVPVKLQGRIVVAVVRVAFPVAWQPDGIRGFFETPIAQEFSVKTAFNILVHELHDLAIEHRADPVLYLLCVDRDAGAGRRLLLCAPAST